MVLQCAIACDYVWLCDEDVVVADVTAGEQSHPAAAADAAVGQDSTAACARLT